MNRAVLVVDDDPRSRKLARDTLASLGYVVIEATTAEQAVELAGHVPPALILMDIRLPGMSGLEALVELRANQALKGVPVVAVTAVVVVVAIVVPEPMSWVSSSAAGRFCTNT